MALLRAAPRLVLLAAGAEAQTEPPPEGPSEARPEAQQTAPAALHLDRAFGDHMVLQRERPIRITGGGAPGEVVTVRLAHRSGRTTCDDQGRFEVTLDPLRAGGPHTLSVRSGRERLELEDILLGEVWLCAGQSNMRWMLSQSATAAEALAEADLPELRLLDLVGVGVPNSRPWTDEVLAACAPETYYRTDGWTPSSAESARSFSAVAWFFGRSLQERLGVPVGLIHNAIGGTCTEAYISPEALAAEPRLAPPEGWLDDARVPEWPRQRGKQNLARWLAAPREPMPGHPFQPGFLFEAGIRPFTGLQLAGVLWYQGESNATRADMQVAADPELARLSLETLVRDWRLAFDQADLPFLMVQLPAMQRSWMEYREVQRQVARDPLVELAVTLDLGDPRDVHPRRKREVGERLADLALLLHREPDAAPRLSPRVRSAWRSGSEGLVAFDERGGGLATADGGPVQGLELQAEDGSWHAATGVQEGTRLRVQAAGVTHPQAVRYAWAPVPTANLVGASGTPVGPFVEVLAAEPEKAR